MKAFLTYTQHCEQLYRHRLAVEQSSDEDEVFVTPEKKEDIKEQETTDPFPEHLIAIMNS